jgi:DNA-binding CsgD family transcriptional regulator
MTFNAHNLQVLTPGGIPLGTGLSDAVLDTLRFGVVVLDAAGAPVLWNSALRQIIADDDGVRLRASGIEFENAEDHAHFLATLERARRSKEQGHPSVFAFSANRPSGRRAYSITVTLLSSPQNAIAPHPTLVIVSVSDPVRLDFTKIEVLMAQFALTAAESRLALSLVELGSLARASKTCGLTTGSARQYMKRIFAKTSVKSQVELVGLILGVLRV